MQQHDFKVFIRLDFSVISYLDLNLARIFMGFHRDHFVQRRKIIWGFCMAIDGLDEE
jgi:hypothetical protein